MSKMNDNKGAKAFSEMKKILVAEKSKLSLMKSSPPANTSALMLESKTADGCHAAIRQHDWSIYQ